jgi:hypothetical protein
VKKSTHRHIALPLFAASLAAALTAALAGCPGRDPSAFRSGDEDPVEPGPIEPGPDLRTASARPLFGTMPVENRILDPLMTMTGSGWFGFANDFRSYPTIDRRVAASPTGTPFFEVRGEANRAGATLLGQVKVARIPLHLEVWIGRSGEEAELGFVHVALAGLFADEGERAVDLEPDPASRVVIDGNAWVRFRADLDEGPVGWAYLMAADASRTPVTVLIGGAVAIERDPQANAALVPPVKRSLRQSEARLVEAVREKTRQLAAPRAPVPPPLPGLPAR